MYDSVITLASISSLETPRSISGVSNRLTALVAEPRVRLLGKGLEMSLPKDAAPLMNRSIQTSKNFPRLESEVSGLICIVVAIINLAQPPSLPYHIPLCISGTVRSLGLGYVVKFIVVGSISISVIHSILSTSDDQDQRFLRAFCTSVYNLISRLLPEEKRRIITQQAGPERGISTEALSQLLASVAGAWTTTVTMRYTSLLWALGASAVHAQNSPMQVTVPSNDSTDLLPASTSPRFLLNGTEFPDLPVLSLAPLGPYVQLTRTEFVQVDVTRQLINVNIDNSNDVADNKIAYISCDPEAYSGYLNATDALSNVLYSGSTTVIVVLYSEYSNHCEVSNLDSAPGISGILTTINPMAATTLAKLDLSLASSGMASILPDLNSYTNTSGSGNFGNNGNLLGPSPTTAVAMIILYSITGIITALFIIIIITGAIRAHRHPERYGPRTIAGRMRQSRAKGIARAMLETLPIVKFGDHTDLPAKPTDPAHDADGTRDIEMSHAQTETTTAHDATTTPEKAVAEAGAGGAIAGTESAAHDGTTEDGALSCSICTEDFTKGEEVRVLPCNHKFHPDCVDPWLLNVSGTCPLCRIDLRPVEEQTEEGPAVEDAYANLPAGEGTLHTPPPLGLLSVGDGSGNHRRGTLAGLRGVAHGTRDERIAALRRYRLERRRNAHVDGQGEAPEQQAERRGVFARLRVRTTRVTEGMERLQRAL